MIGTPSTHYYQELATTLDFRVEQVEDEYEVVIFDKTMGSRERSPLRELFPDELTALIAGAEYVKRWRNYALHNYQSMCSFVPEHGCRDD